MTDPRLFRLRCRFIEQGRLVYLSHLEVARTLERTVRRADLPFAVSQGFSPHMRIAFGAALPVGIGSTCELFDVLLTEYVPAEKAFATLQEASVADLMVTSCEYVEPKAPAASVAFPFSTYEVVFQGDPGTIEVPKELSVVRKRKEKVLEVGEYLVEPFTVEGDRAIFTLEAKPTGSLRPDLLCSNITASSPIISITRIEQRSELGR